MPRDENRLVIDVARLERDGENISGETDEGLLELDNDPYITPEGGIFYDLFVTQLGDELLVRGSVGQDALCVCARCGEQFETTVKDEDFVRSYQINEKTEFLDLTDEAREAIILAFPSYPVCDAGCQGLCPSCGANLNRGTCTCINTVAGGAFADLDAMIKEKSDKNRNKQRK